MALLFSYSALVQAPTQLVIKPEPNHSYLSLIYESDLDHLLSHILGKLETFRYSSLGKGVHILGNK